MSGLNIGKIPREMRRQWLKLTLIFGFICSIICGSGINLTPEHEASEIEESNGAEQNPSLRLPMSGDEVPIDALPIPEGCDPFVQLPVLIERAQEVVVFTVCDGDDVLKMAVSFCGEYSLIREHCSMLYNRARTMYWKTHDIRHQERVRRGINESKALVMGDDLHIDNSWPRLEDAYFNQMAQEIIPGRAVRLSYPNLCPEDMNKEVQRVVIIHSCTFDDQVEDVLTEMLERIALSGLLKEVMHMWILNYGTPRSGNMRLGEDASEIFKDQKHKISYLHIDNTCSQFEIPTITSIRAFSEVLDPSTQILYMHTKGVSYQPPIPQPMTDWRRMMEYFLVEQHKSVFHLLASGQYDAVGTSYRFEHDRQFVGNFWWTNAGYMNTLRQNVVKENSTNPKFDAETYVLSGAYPRIFVMHDPPIILGKDLYPREAYADRPSYQKCTTINVCL